MRIRVILTVRFIVPALSILFATCDDHRAEYRDVAQTSVGEKVSAESAALYALPKLPRTDETQRSDVKSPRDLRHAPLDSLTADQVTTMLQTMGLVDLQRNPSAPGISHSYSVLRLPVGFPTFNDQERVIIDSTTALMWQWMGSSLGYYEYDGAVRYVRWLNQNRFAGYADWALPTLEEAMSLLEADSAADSRFWRIHEPNVHLGLVFPQNTRICWTCDRNGTQKVWRVDYAIGTCELVDLYPSNGRHTPTAAIRAVREIK